MFGLPFNQIDKLQATTVKAIEEQPVIRKGVLKIKEVGDTYLDLQKWGKGCVWVNGHNLGRYWSVGPQQTVYVPAEWLKKGDNEIVVLELNKPAQTVLQGIAKPILDKLQGE